MKQKNQTVGYYKCPHCGKEAMLIRRTLTDNLSPNNFCNLDGTPIHDGLMIYCQTCFKILTEVNINNFVIFNTQFLKNGYLSTCYIDPLVDSINKLEKLSER